MKRDDAATQPETLGFTLSLSREAALLGLRDRVLAPGMLLEQLDLRVAEIEQPFNLDGRPDSFRHHATTLERLVLRVDLEAVITAVRDRLWAEDLPVAEICLVGEAPHVVLEARYGRRRTAVLRHVLLGAGPRTAVRLLLGPAHLFGVPEPSTAPMLGALVRALESLLASAPVPKALGRPVGSSGFELDPVTWALWSLLPTHGWKVPRLEDVRCSAIEVDLGHVRFVFDRGTVLAADPELAEQLAEGETMDEADLLVERDRLPEAVDVLLGSKTAANRWRALELAAGAPELHEKIIASARDRPPELLALGLAHEHRGDEDEAQRYLRRAADQLSALGHNRAAGWALATMARAGPLQQRVARLEEAVALRPDDTQILGELMDALPSVGRSEAALRAARRLARVALEPALQVEALLGAGRILRDQLGEPEAARKTFEAALKLAPGDPAVTEELAVAYGREGRLPPAVELIDQLVRQAKDASRPRRASRLMVQSGQLWSQAGQPDRAWSHFKEAWDLDPGNLEALRALFEIARAAGQQAAALELLSESREAIPEHGPRSARVFLAAAELFMEDEPVVGHEALGRAWRADGSSEAVQDARLRWARDPAELPVEQWLAGAGRRFEEADDDAGFDALMRVSSVAHGREAALAYLVSEGKHWGPERLHRASGLAAQLEAPEVAQRLLERAIQRSSGDARLSLQAVLAVRLLRAGHVFEAMRMGLQLGMDAPLRQLGTPEAKAILLHALVAKRSWDAASQVFEAWPEELLSLPEPVRALVALDLAKARVAQGNHRAAAADLRAAMEGLTDEAEARRVRGRLADLYRVLGDRSGLAEMRRAEAGLSSTAGAERALLYMEAARTALRAGERELARQDAERAVECAREAGPEFERRAIDLLARLSPGSEIPTASGTVKEKAAIERAELARSEGRLEEAQTWLEEAARVVRGSDRLARKLAEVLSELGRPAEAGRWWREASRRSVAVGRKEDAADDAARAAVAFTQADLLEEAKEADSAALEFQPARVDSLDRALERARDDGRHEDVLELIGRRLGCEDGGKDMRPALEFEKAQVLGFVFGRWEAAVDVLAGLHPPERAAVQLWDGWAVEHGLLRPGPSTFDAVAELDITVEDRVWAWTEGARRWLAEGGPPAGALARVEAALRLDPGASDARLLRRALLKDGRDAWQRAVALEEEAGSDLAAWLDVGAAFVSATAEHPEAESRASAAFLRVLNEGGDAAGVVARAVGLEDVRLAALGRLERTSSSSEERWACRIVRTHIQLSGTPSRDALAELSARSERAWELLDQLDADRLGAALMRLGVEVSPREAIIDIGLDATALSQSWSAHAAWLARRAGAMEDPGLACALWTRSAAALLEAGQEEHAVRALRTALATGFEAREPVDLLAAIFGGRGEWEALAAELGPPDLERLWHEQPSPGLGRVLASRMRASDARSRVLLKAAELAAPSLDPIEVELLEEVAEQGPPPLAVDALTRLELRHLSRGAYEVAADALRRRMSLEDEDAARAALQARLGDLLAERLDDDASAEREYLSALALDPEHPGARAGLGRLLTRGSRFEELVAALGPDALLDAQHRLIRDGDYERAMSAAETLSRQSTELDPWTPLLDLVPGEDARRVSVLARIARGGGEDALNELKHRFAETPDDRERSRLAELLADLVRGPERVRYLRHRVEAGPTEDLSEELLKDAFAADPEHDPSLLRLSRRLAEQGRFDELAAMLARDGFERAIDGFLEGPHPERAERLLIARSEASEDPAPYRARATELALNRGDVARAWSLFAEGHASPGDSLLVQLADATVALPEDGVSASALARIADVRPHHPNLGLMAVGALRKEGAEAVVSALGPGSARGEAVAAALRVDVERFDPGEGVHARAALAALLPEAPEADRWLADAFEGAVSGVPDALPAVVEPWVHSAMRRRNPAERADDIRRLRDAYPGDPGPEVALLSLLTALEMNDLDAAVAEADALFDNDAAAADVRREAAEVLVQALSSDPNRREALERAWVELSRSETVPDDDARVVALRSLAELRERRGAEPSEIARPLEAAIGLGMLAAEEIEVRRALRELWEQAGDWPKAEAQQSALAELTGAVEDWLLLAELRVWTSDAEGAQQALSLAAKSDPEDARVAQMRLRLAEQSSDNDQVIELLLNLARVGSTEPERLERAVRAVEAAGQDQTLKVSTMEAAIDGAPSTDVEGLLHRLRPLMSDLDEAQRDALLIRALKRWPAASSGHVRLALAERLRERGEAEEAESIILGGLEGALSADHPLLDMARKLTIPEEVLERLEGEVGAALVAEQAARATDMDPQRAHRLWNLALRCHPSVRAEAARALEGRKPADLEAVTARAEAALRAGVPERALTLLEESGAVTDRVGAQALARLGRWSEARDVLFRLAEMSPDDERVRLLCASSRIAWEKLGQFGEAAEALDLAASVRPDHRLGRMATDLWVAAGRPERAVQRGRAVLERLSQDDPRRVSGVLGHAGALLAAGEQEQAERGIAQLASDPLAARLRAQLFMQQERWEDAARALEAAPREDDVGSFERTAVCAWLWAKTEPERLDEVRAVFEQWPTLDPPGVARLPWIATVAQSVGLRSPACAAALLGATERVLGQVPRRLMRRWVETRDLPAARGALLADPSATLVEWRAWLERSGATEELRFLEPPAVTEERAPAGLSAHVTALREGTRAEREAALERFARTVSAERALTELRQLILDDDPMVSSWCAVAARLARQCGDAVAETDVLQRWLEVARPEDRSICWRRLAVLQEARDAKSAYENLLKVAERERVTRSVLNALARCARRADGPRAEAEAWARFGSKDAAALSRAAILRGRDLEDRRSAHATWAAAARLRPDDLSLRWGIVGQSLGLGDAQQAEREALDAAAIARADGRLEAQIAFRLAALEARLQGGRDDDPEAWAAALDALGAVPVLLEAAVAAARRSKSPERFAQLLAVRIEQRGPGPERGRLRVALARIYERPLGAEADGAAARRAAAEEDFEARAEAQLDAPGQTVPPLQTTDLGVSPGRLELSGRLEELARRGEARATSADDPFVKARLWLEVARHHARRSGAEGASEARRALNRSVRAHPYLIEAWMELAYLELAASDWNGAQRSLDRLMKMGGPPWALAEVELRAARVAMELGEEAEALELLGSAVESDPRSLGALRGVAEIAKGLSDPRDRVGALQRLADGLDPVIDAEERARIALELARIHVELRDYDAAIRSVEEASAHGVVLSGQLELQVGILQAAQAPRDVIDAVQVRLCSEGRTDVATGFQAALRLGDAEAIDRIGARIMDERDPDALRAWAEHVRVEGDLERWSSAMRALGDAATDATTEELSGLMRLAGTRGRTAEVFRWLASAEDPAAVLERLAPGPDAGTARFWLRGLAEQLELEDRRDPRVTEGLRRASAALPDQGLERMFAESLRSRGATEEARPIFERWVRALPCDLQLLEAYVDLRPDASGAAWVRSFFSRGAGRPSSAPASRWLDDLARARVPEFEPARFEEEFDDLAREGVGVLLLETRQFGDIPILRQHDMEADVEVRLGRDPAVWIPWSSPLEADSDALRFLAATEFAFAYLTASETEPPEEGWVSVADQWALDLVPDLRAACDVLARWGLGHTMVPLEDPKARTDAVQSSGRLFELVRAVVLR